MLWGMCEREKGRERETEREDVKKSTSIVIPQEPTHLSSEVP